MLQIFLGPLRRPAMRSCYAGWNRVTQGDTDKIDRVRRSHAQRHVATHNATTRSDKGQNGGKSTPCVYYNKNSSGQKAAHETKGVLYRHICSFCWSKDGKQFAHPQSQNQTKNE